MDNRPLFQVPTSAGIQRDGTTIDSSAYVDGEWVRFNRGRPRKIGGYRAFVEDLTYQSRGLFMYSKNNTNSVYTFSSNDLKLVQIDNNATGTLSFDLTPGGFTAQTDYLWQADALYDATGGGKAVVVAHPGRNLNDITATTNTALVHTTAGSSTTAFANINDGSGGTVSVSGGVVSLQPYLFAYGNDGLIKNCNANKPNDWRITVGGDANEANVSYTKIVKGMAMRGGAQSPAGLFWSLDSVIRVSYVGGAQKFRYDTVGRSTIMSSSAVTELDGVFFWMGIDRFYLYDGAVRELPNSNNINYIFDNLNFDQRQKVFAVAIPRWGEVWWFYPHGHTETECTRAAVFNVRDKLWFDTAIVRGAAVPAQVVRFPVMAGATTNAAGKYSLYAHELGYNRVENGVEVAIRSFFETRDFGLPTGGTDGEKPVGQDYWTRLTRIEPDFVQQGEMSVTVVGSEFINSPIKENTYTFTPETQKIDMREQRRMIRLRFESDVAGGFYEAGRTILYTEPGDLRS